MLTLHLVEQPRRSGRRRRTAGQISSSSVVWWWCSCSSTKRMWSVSARRTGAPTGVRSVSASRRRSRRSAWCSTVFITSCCSVGSSADRAGPVTAPPVGCGVTWWLVRWPDRRRRGRMSSRVGTAGPADMGSAPEQAGDWLPDKSRPPRRLIPRLAEFRSRPQPFQDRSGRCGCDHHPNRTTFRAATAVSGPPLAPSCRSYLVESTRRGSSTFQRCLAAELACPVRYRPCSVTHHFSVCGWPAHAG